MPATRLYARSPQPLYLQIAAVFRSNIHSRLWLPGQQVPPLEALVDQYGVARSTVRQAFGLLENEGLIRRARGSGTFVNEALPHTPTLLIPKNWEAHVAFSNQLRPVATMAATAGVALPSKQGMPC